MNPIYFFEIDGKQNQTIIPEVFVELSRYSFPEVRDIYQISNHGRIYSNLQNRILSINIDSKGYSYKPLLLKDGGSRNYRVHRLVLMTFEYVPGCENLIVNHKDLNKTNNIITNLEWTDYSGNAIHAYQNGAIDKAKMYRFKYGDEELIRSICKDLQDGKLRSKDIADKYQIPVDNVDAIKYRKAHTHISKDFDFKIGKSNMLKDIKKVSYDEIIFICKYFQEHPIPKDATHIHHYDTTLLNTMGKELNTTNYRILQRIRRRESYYNISKDFNW